MRRRQPHSGQRLAGRLPGRAGAPSASRPDVEKLTAYLDMLAGAEPSGALLEVRVRHPERQTMRRWFIEIGARRRFVTQLPVIAAHADVYLGCAPRQMRSGTARPSTAAGSPGPMSTAGTPRSASLALPPSRP
jgi:hypothetical protein